MTVFQLTGIVVALGFAIVSLVAGLRHRIGRTTAFVWLLVWLAAAVAFYEPELTRMLANRLGIQRGADLVFYCGILAALVGFFLVFARLRRAEESLTRLVREIALQQATQPGSESEERS